MNIRYFEPNGEQHTALARMMFNRQVASYDADPEEANLAWMNEGIRKFWLDEAWAVLVFVVTGKGDG